MSFTCNCPHSEFPLEWSEHALVWMHRHPRLDRKCLNPPLEYRSVHIKEGYTVKPYGNETPQSWAEAFPDIYRLEYRLAVPWTEFLSAARDKEGE